MSKRYGRSGEETMADLAYAFANDIDPIDYLRQQCRARGWSGSSDEVVEMDQ